MSSKIYSDGPSDLQTLSLKLSGHLRGNTLKMGKNWGSNAALPANGRKVSPGIHAYSVQVFSNDPTTSQYGSTWLRHTNEKLRNELVFFLLRFFLRFRWKRLMIDCPQEQTVTDSDGDVGIGVVQFVPFSTPGVHILSSVHHKFCEK